MSETPFEGGGFIPPTRGSRVEAHAAARMLARLACDDAEGLRTVLEALGLVGYRETADA